MPGHRGFLRYIASVRRYAHSSAAPSASQVDHADKLPTLLTSCRSRQASPPRMPRSESLVDQEVTE
jgi:hypothetical protein